MPVTEADLKELLAQARQEVATEQAKENLPDIDPAIWGTSPGAPIEASTEAESSLLENLWDNLSHAEEVVRSSSEDIEFDTGLEGAAPNERVRFQIGRQSPPRIPFNTGHIPQDGRVVARMDRGSFQQILPTPSSSPPTRIQVATPATTQSETPRRLDRFEILKSGLDLD